MEIWKRVFRNGFAPLLTYAGLKALYEALRTDDKRLIQGVSTRPPPLIEMQDYPMEAADSIALCFWLGDELENVGEVEEAWVRVMFDCCHALGEPAACRWYINWADDVPRHELRRQLLPEVERALELKRGGYNPNAFEGTILTSVGGFQLTYEENG